MLGFLFLLSQGMENSVHHLLSYFAFSIFFFLLKINTNYHVWQMCMCDLSTLYILKGDGDSVSVRVEYCVFPCPLHILPACSSILILFLQWPLSHVAMPIASLLPTDHWQCCTWGVGHRCTVLIVVWKMTVNHEKIMKVEQCSVQLVVNFFNPNFITLLDIWYLLSHLWQLNWLVFHLLLSFGCLCLPIHKGVDSR